MGRNFYDAFKNEYLVRKLENSQKQELRDPSLWEFKGMLQEFTAEIKTCDEKYLGEFVVSVFWKMPLRFEEQLNSGKWVKMVLLLKDGNFKALETETLALYY
ncbi:MAG: hypothetical protein J6N81_11590 [Treponema sp.]|nr:hypothetical protein [Treponema sp.]